MLWQILCDFDGTIATEDVTDSLLQRFAAPAWLEIEAEWKAGRIGSRECMTRQIAMIRATPDAIDRHLDGIHLDPHFSRFVRHCRRHAIPLTVVSDGIDYVIHRLLRRDGLDDLAVVSNRLEQIAPDRYRLRFPHAREDCRSASGTCKCAAAQMSAPRRRTLLIGDGASDQCAAAAVDLVFAKGSLLTHCARLGLPHVACTNFAEAHRLLAALINIDDEAGDTAASPPDKLEDQAFE
ncbi:MAG: MtnX-like HAD-IB family phosphatase [Proteobacteria bacterium]|nr:MtnX-like HAD-IB family phosphatase [Pseudomonadota bacterium]